MAHTLEYALADTSYDLELDKIKSKIQKLYRDLLVKTFKMANPNATPEELANFLEKNDLDFKGDGFEIQRRIFLSKDRKTHFSFFVYVEGFEARLVVPVDHEADS